MLEAKLEEVELSLEGGLISIRVRFMRTSIGPDGGGWER